MAAATTPNQTKAKTPNTAGAPARKSKAGQGIRPNHKDREMPAAKTHRPARPRFSGAPDNFTNARVSFTHWETGITFTTKGERMNITIRHNGEELTIGTKYLGDYGSSATKPTASYATLRTAAAGWLDANPEAVKYYGNGGPVRTDG
jgi:hypothetical protein